MKDTKQRKPGKYTEIFTKIMDGITYKKSENYVIGENYEITHFSRSYNPPIKFGKETDGWEQS